MARNATFEDFVLMSRRAGGDAGHVLGCVRDHALSSACTPRLTPGSASSADGHDTALMRDLRDVGTGKIAHVYAGSCPDVSGEGADTERDRADPADECPACEVLRRADAALGDDAHERALAKVEAARAALRENLRAGYALDEGQIATVLRMADTLAAGVPMEARETLGR